MVAMVSAALLVTGCALLQPGERKRWSRVADAPLVRVVHYPAPSMQLKQSSHVGVGMLVGGIPGILFGSHTHKVMGTGMQEEYDLRPPIELVQERFVAGLRHGLALDNLEVTAETVPSVLKLDPPVPGELVFILHTDRAKFSFFLTDWRHYRLKYSANARLIRRDSGYEMWKGFCKYYSNDDPGWEEIRGDGDPSVNQMQDYNGRVARLMIARAAEVCADRLLTAFFGTVPAIPDKGSGPVRVSVN